MRNLYDEMPNGYQESIQKGLSTVRYFSRNMSFPTGSKEERISGLKKEIEAAYADFLRRHESLHVLYLELGVGANTPVIVKYPFWQMTLANEKSVYACINYGEAFCPGESANRSICIDGDIGEVFAKI